MKLKFNVMGMRCAACSSNIEKTVSKLSGVFVPNVILIAIIASAIWLIAGYPFEFALSIGISVLVISCPCALGLETSVSIMGGTGKAAENWKKGRNDW